MIITLTRQEKNQLQLEIGDVALRIACVAGHLPEATPLVELLAWIGSRVSPRLINTGSTT